MQLNMQSSSIISNVIEENSVKLSMQFHEALPKLKKFLLFVVLILFPVNFGLCESVLDRFMDDSYGNDSNIVTSDSGLDYNSTVSSYSSETSKNTINIMQHPVSAESNLDESLDAISKLSKIENEKLDNLEFSLIGSDIIDTYRYLAIGDGDRFAKSVKKIVMKSDNPKIKAEGYYLTGLLRMKEKDYKSAGQNFLDGYKHGQEYFFGAYNLFGLARAMNALGKKEESCAALDKLVKMIDSEDSDTIYPSLFITNVKSYFGKSCR